MKKEAKKLLFSSAVALAIALSGCGDAKNSDEADKYDVMMDIDKGNYDSAISALKSDCAGFSQTECNMLIGSAYYAKAGYDLNTMGKGLVKIDGECEDDQNCKDTKTTEAIFDKLFSDYMQEGINYYKKVLPDENNSLCNTDYYDNLNINQKDACLAINPILLQDILNTEEGKKKNSGTVSIEHLIKFKNVLEAAAPGLTTKDIVAITQGDELPKDQDINGNGKLDSLEATECAINSANCTGITRHDLGKFENNNSINVIVVEIGTKKLVRYVANINSSLTTLGLDATKHVQLNGDSCSKEDNETSGTNGCYTSPKKEETLNDTIVTVLNNDEVFESIAVANDTDTGKSKDEKVEELKEDICDATISNGNVANKGKCDTTASGELIITQDALLDYMAEDTK